MFGNGNIVTDTDLLADKYVRDEAAYKKWHDARYPVLNTDPLPNRKVDFSGWWVLYSTIGILSGGIMFVLLAPLALLLIIIQSIVNHGRSEF